MLVMRNKTLLTVAACILAMVFAAPAHAQRNMGICTDWNPDGLAGCITENPLTGTLADLTDPEFSVAAIGKPTIGTIDQIVVLVLSPGAAAPVFTVEFTSVEFNTDGTIASVGTPFAPAAIENVAVFNSNDDLIGSIAAEGGSLLGGKTIASGADWSYNNIAGVQLEPGVTQYEVDVFYTGAGNGIDGAPLALIPTSVMRVAVSGVMLPGTIFLAIGLDANGNVIFSMPLTQSLQLVPEPTSLVLLGSGLFALGFLRRKKLFS